MKTFETYKEIQKELLVGTFLFRPEFGPAQFRCGACKQCKPLNMDGKVGGTGYAVAHEVMLCYACCDAMAREEMKTRKPFGCYISDDTTRVVTWTGGELGHIVRIGHSRGFQGTKLMHIRVRDVHGMLWFGTGLGKGMCITLRPMKCQFPTLRGALASLEQKGFRFEVRQP